MPRDRDDDSAAVSRLRFSGSLWPTQESLSKLTFRCKAGDCRLWQTRGSIDESALIESGSTVPEFPCLFLHDTSVQSSSAATLRLQNLIEQSFSSPSARHRRVPRVFESLDGSSAVEETFWERIWWFGQVSRSDLCLRFGASAHLCIPIWAGLAKLSISTV